MAVIRPNALGPPAKGAPAPDSSEPMRVFPLFALLLIGFPLLELYILIKLGTVIGAFPTVALVVGTALLGAFLLRRQGLSNYRRMQQSMARGEVPAQEMLEGVVILLGAVLLLVPGVITDVLGLLCLLPPLRRVIVAFWLRRTVVEMQVSSRVRGTRDGRVYDAEYRHLPSDDDR